MTDRRTTALLALAMLFLGLGLGVEAKRFFAARAASGEAEGGAGRPRPSRGGETLSGLSVEELTALLASPKGDPLAELLTEALMKSAALRARWLRLVERRSGWTAAERLGAMKAEPGFDELLKGLEKEPWAASELARLKSRQIDLAQDRMLASPPSARRPGAEAGAARSGGAALAPVSANAPAGRALVSHGSTLDLGTDRSRGRSARPRRADGAAAGAAVGLAAVETATAEQMRRLLEVYPWLGSLSTAERTRVVDSMDALGLWGSCFAARLFQKCYDACAVSGGACVPIDGWKSCLEAHDGDAAACRPLCAAEPGCVVPPPETGGSPPPEPSPGDPPLESGTPAPCDPKRQPAPHWGVKDGYCRKSCGMLNGSASFDDACANHGLADAGIAHDVVFCCKPPCDPAQQTPPTWGVKDLKCVKSCGATGGTHSFNDACSLHGYRELATAYDVVHCCE